MRTTLKDCVSLYVIPFSTMTRLKPKSEEKFESITRTGLWTVRARHLRFLWLFKILGFEKRFFMLPSQMKPDHQIMRTDTVWVIIGIKCQHRSSKLIWILPIAIVMHLLLLMNSSSFVTYPAVKFICLLKIKVNSLQEMTTK